MVASRFPSFSFADSISARHLDILSIFPGKVSICSQYSFMRASSIKGGERASSACTSEMPGEIVMVLLEKVVSL
jgi:hypothetical protein